MDEATRVKTTRATSYVTDRPSRMIGRLIVGFDGSPASANALDWAVSRALLTGSAIRVTGVVDDDDGAMGAEYARQRAHDHAALLSETAARLGAVFAGLDVTTRLVEGPIAPGLAGSARPEDTVVIGSDKTGYARGRLYGVRSVQLAALVPGPLVVVPAADLRLRDGVVVAIDGGPQSAGVARAGAEEASIRDCRISLIHAVPPEAAADGRHRGDVVLHDALETVHSIDPTLQVTRHLTSRRPAEAILNLSRDRALLLVGRSRHTPSPGIGGTLHAVLINANVPVMILPGTPSPKPKPRTIETEED
jgi:nucleotide-binding universal stress UspA family protein